MEKGGQRLIQSMQEAFAYLEGDKKQGRLTKKIKVKKIDIPEVIDVKSIREHLKMSQVEFATRFALNVGTLRNWEYGRRSPDLTAKTYLYLIEKHSDLIERSLRSN